MKKFKFDNIDERLERYEDAVQERLYYVDEFQEAYRYAFPNRNKWEGSFTTKQSIEKYRNSDPTAQEATQQFASNMQNIILPLHKDCIKLTPGSDYDHNENKLIDESLERATNKILQYWRASNLSQELNLAFQDSAISTGLLMTHFDPENKMSPLSFEAVPMYNVVIAEYRGRIVDVWHIVMIKARNILSHWPKAELNSALLDKIHESPNEDIEFIEGITYYPQNPENKRYLFSVIHKESKHELIYEPRSWTPFIPIRFNLASGETWGCGPVRSGLPAIRNANMITDLELAHAALNVQMPMMNEIGQYLNFDTMNIKPGASIAVENIAKPPLAPLKVTGDLRFSQLVLQELQQHIRDMLFADPLGPASNKTATEIQAREQHAMKRDNAALNRIESETAHPLTILSAHLLAEHGFIDGLDFGSSSMEFRLDGMNVQVNIENPLRNLQKKQTVQDISTLYTYLGQIVGPELAAGATNIEKLPKLLSENLNVTSSLVKSEDEIKKLATQLVQQAQQAQQAQVQQPQPSGNPNQQSQGA